MRKVFYRDEGDEGDTNEGTYPLHPLHPCDRYLHPCDRYKALAALLLVIAFASIASAQVVRVQRKTAEKRVDVTVDGKPFTSYRWDERILRPVLYPIFSGGGSFVTRGFPFETRDGDTIDHPHQVGSSFSYGNVNGIDFWNSSTFRTAEEMKRMGRIVHSAVVSTTNGNGRGELVTMVAWVGPDGSTMLTERTRYTFYASGSRTMDRSRDEIIGVPRRHYIW